MARLVAAVVLTALATIGAARGEERAIDDGASIDLRVFGGIGNGLGAEAWLPGRRVRIDADLEAIWPGDLEWGGLAAVVPLAGDRRGFVGLRAGTQLEYTGDHVDGGWMGSRFAQAVDAGLVGHLASRDGSSLEAELGGEGVFRGTRAICCDDAALRTRSFGVRASVRGDLALSPSWGLFAQAGRRTADHLLEIEILPTLSAGVRHRF
jgi:hypothetical protein